HTKADIFDPSTNTLTRDALDVPTGSYNGTGTGAQYLSVPAPIATVTGAGIAALSVDSSNEITAVACYAAGTLIRTDRGEIAVEALAIGDHVVTASGEARPIHWLGKRSYGGRFIMGRKDILPICFKAGALDDNVPHRDLWVSPHHAMYCEGVLIEAKDLVNGVSVVQAESVERVEYFHIEFETHDVIIAEGALSESFVDDDSRGMFHNAHEYQVLYPDTPNEPARFYAPRLEHGYEVEAARRRIELRAGIRNARDDRPVPLRGYVEVVAPRYITGWAQNVDHPEAPVCLDIYAGGVLIGQTLANRYREDLESSGLGSGRHSFVFTPPPGLRFSPDAIEVRRSLDGTALEFAGERGRRIAASDDKPKLQRVAAVTPDPKVKVFRRRIA
ncbi:MAG TPA: Hint domain-containing protein, partial [Bradyrhizobium sp.]